MCEIDQENTNCESKNTKDSSAKNTVNNNTIEHKPEQTNSRNEINECNSYKDINIFGNDKEKKKQENLFYPILCYEFEGIYRTRIHLCDG